MKIALDHLVIAADTLDAGAAYVADVLGVMPEAGGQHPTMGTHNRLLGLFGGVYLEIIAIDPDGQAPARSRWFGLDSDTVRGRLQADGPFLLHWVARVERPTDLSAWQSQYPAQIAPVLPMTRGDLRWRITVPDDGGLPGWQAPVAADGSDATRIDGNGLLPTLIQWDVPIHPSTRLQRQDLALRRLCGTHPHAEALREAMRWLGGDDLIALSTPDEGDPAGAPGPLVAGSLVAEIETPNGIRLLK